MEQKEFEVIIMGTGPAGLQAAIHAAEEHLSRLTFETAPRCSLASTQHAYSIALVVVAEGPRAGIESG